jgi:hypothetical protein
MSVSKYSSQGKWKWNPDSVPQISFKNGKLEISNLDKLNLFSKVETNSAGTATKSVNLWDKIQQIWDSTIWVGKKPNATTLEQFLRALKKEVHISYEWWDSNMIGILRKWVDTAWNKFKKSLTTDSKKSLWEAVNTSAWDIQLSNTFDDLIGSLDGSIYSVWAAEKATRSTQATKQLFKIINDKLWIDVNNEINAWVANMALYGGRDSAQELIETIYPSVPWMYEYLIKSFLWAAKKAWARRATQDYTQQIWEASQKNLQNMIWGGVYVESD